jgi:hypothetical protein
VRFISDRQATLDIRNAELLMSLAQGLTREESAGALKYRAATGGVSLHAAALAFVAPGPTAQAAGASSSGPGSRPWRHLFAVPSGAELEAPGLDRSDTGVQ